MKKSLGACTKREAQVKMQNFIASHAATPALKGITKSPNLYTWLDRYLKIRQGELSKATMDIHKQCVRQLKEFFPHDPRIEQIQRPAATDWRLWLSEKGGANGKPLGEATVCRQAKTAKVIMRYAMTEGLIGVNPFEHLKVTPPVRDHTENRFVQYDEVLAVMQECSEIEPLIMFCYWAGLRYSEALHLKYSDVLCEESKIIIRTRGGKVTSKQKPREVLFCKELYAWGKHAARRVYARIHGVSPTDASYLKEPGFADRTISGILERGRQQLPQRLLKKACITRGIEPFCFRDLRKTRSTLWFTKYPKHVAEAWMGHTEEVARKHYLSVQSEFYSSESNKDVDHEGTMRHHKDDTPQRNESTCDTTDGLIRRSGSGPYWTYPAYRSSIGPIRVSRCGGAK